RRSLRCPLRTPSLRPPPSLHARAVGALGERSALAESRTSSPKSPARTQPPAPSQPPSAGLCPRRSVSRWGAISCRPLSECTHVARLVLGSDHQPLRDRVAPGGSPQGSSHTPPPSSGLLPGPHPCGCVDRPRASTRCRCDA